MVRIQLVEGPLPPFVPREGGGGTGAELVFHGRVRDREGGRPIVALDYEYYPGMTERELDALAREVVERFGLHELVCLHRIGPVGVGEASVRVVVRSAHRREALAALEYFVAELKRRVPLWKWGVTAGGERFPSGGEMGENERSGR